MKDIIKKYGMLVVSLMTTLLAVVCFLVIANNRNAPNIQMVEKQRFEAEYRDDYEGKDGMARLIDSCDHVFIGEVKAYKDTKYEDKYTFTDANQKEKTVANIFTEYDVSVVKDYKNELQIGSVIPVDKLGGVDETSTCVNVLENDELLTIGHRYLFIVSSAKYEYTACGPHSTIDLGTMEGINEIDDLNQLKQNITIDVK